MMISDRPEATASSTTYWIVGLSTRGSISLGCALVAGRNRVPSPAAGKTALRTLMRGLLSGANRGPLLPVECFLDATSQLALDGLASLGGHAGRESQQHVAATPSNDTLRFRPVQRARRLAGPGGAHLGQDRQRLRHRHLAG